MITEYPDGMEAVLFIDGWEADWIDPLVSIDETVAYWVVSNGVHKYKIEKGDLRKLVAREMREEDR